MFFFSSLESESNDDLITLTLGFDLIVLLYFLSLQLKHSTSRFRWILCDNHFL